MMRDATHELIGERDTGHDVTIEARVTAVQPCLLSRRMTGAWVRLSNAEGDREVLCVDGSSRSVAFRPGQCLRANLLPGPSDTDPPILDTATILDPSELGPRSIPRTLAARPMDLIELVAIARLIRTPALRAFLYGVLAEPHVFEPFVQVPASRNHHHAYPGGLLRHSLEVAVNGLRLAPPNAVLRDLLIVGTLLHDIGKIRVFDAKGKRSNLGHVVDHGELTLELVAPWLVTLDQTWRDGGIALRHIWRSGHPRDRYPDSSLRQIVRQADALSATVARERDCFDSVPCGRNHARPSPGEHYWRPIQHRFP